MDLESARPHDARELAELWCDAFPASRTVAERMRTLETGGRYGGIETVLLTRSAGGLAGACKAYRFEQVFAGRVLPMMGLAAVAVAPFARRRGLGARLCTGALRVARERGDVVSALYPFRPDYYERLGWGLVGELHEHRLHTASLPDDDGAGHVRAATSAADRAAIAACYDGVARASTGPILRDDRIWTHRLTGEDLGVRPVPADAPADPVSHPTFRALVYDRDGVEGYALLRYRHAAAPDRHTLVVRELVAATEPAYRGLLGHLARQADQWPRLLHYARPDERLGDRLRDPRPPGFRGVRSLYFPTARVVRGPMLRVLDVQRALALRGWPDRAGKEAGEAGRGVAFTLEVADDQLPGNRGPWRVRVEGGAAEATPGQAPGGPALTTDAATFARVFAGEITPTAAARIGRAGLSGDGAALDRVFATGQPFWLLDEF